MRLLQPGVPSFNSELRLVKYEALGNDYLVAEDERAAALASRLCDRHLGVGADGVLIVEPATYAVRIVNPDGSEAEKSGNGLRIAAAHLALEHAAPDRFELRPPAGPVSVEVLGRGPGGASTVIDLGAIAVGPREVVAGVTGRAVDAGNPHFVVLEGPVTPERARELGPVIERDARFANRTNVQLAEAVDRGTVRIEIWERGAGYTLASGTSAAAAAAACIEEGLVGDQLSVVMPGGLLPTRRSPDGHIHQVGSAHRVFAALVDLDTFNE